MRDYTPSPLDQRRDDITKAYRMEEDLSLTPLIAKATFSPDKLARIQETAKQLIRTIRVNQKKQAMIDSLLHQYDLSTEEGIALMCLAEALLRIPDTATMDKFISDKLSTANWKNHLHPEHSMFVNAATWSLLLTGKVYAPTLDTNEHFLSALKRGISRIGTTMIRPVILQMMKTLGNQFIIGENIHDALDRAALLEEKGYRFSYDMLGESARTTADAEHYLNAYQTAIDAIGKRKRTDHPSENAGISIKLSALYPRYEYTQAETAKAALIPLLLSLAQRAKDYDIGLTVDAEEADRLDLSLDIFEAVFTDPSLSSSEGLGLAIQAYQKRAFYVIDWLSTLSSQCHKKIMVRLVKGAYWDAEIKQSQVQGLAYPVFTRKNATDVSWLACAKKLLAQPECFYAQFATHNAWSIAAILSMVEDHPADSVRHWEFQCLQGMGRPIYDQVVDKKGMNKPCRIYAPVGTHKDLLGYLVRRLLENGANSSFVNQLSDTKTPLEEIVKDPVGYIAALRDKPHPRIPAAANIYGAWQNSAGIDLSSSLSRELLFQQIQQAKQAPWMGASIINGKPLLDKNAPTVTSPIDGCTIIGRVNKATEKEVEQAISEAHKAKRGWADTPVETRAAILEKAAEMFQQEMPALMAVLNQEGGKCIPDCLSEVRETIDYCRYYAYRAREDFRPAILRGPTGETNQLTLHPRGIIACISPWNFPLAIFTGQIVAALAAGNCVLAKPAEQTPLIAFKAVQILQRAGVPGNVLQLLVGRGRVVGARLVSDERVAGVMFTGSTETAKFIEQTLAQRKGAIAMLIAETGGQNAMIVDSSALPEQTVLDIAQSAFNSAGQRCSALRVLFVQEEIADTLITLLQGYMQTLIVGDPGLLSTDIGPVIDEAAQSMLKQHLARMEKEARLLARVPMQDHARGHFFAPSLVELHDLRQLTGEVFGPVLHVIRYKANELDKVMDSIIETGYGLTLGIHSRIDATIQAIISRMPVGNIYVNRNMIGAVVGVQPFGGEGMSGSGPKAGGPHYLPRLCMERSISNNTTAVGGNARLVSLLEED